jgi:transposase-like protein
MIRKKEPINAKRSQVISEYLTGSSSYKSLSEKYEINARTIQSWVRAYRKSHPETEQAGVKHTGDMKLLKRQLAAAQLKSELLEEMLRLSEKATGLDLRKKFGTRQS